MDIYSALFDSIDNSTFGMAILQGKSLHHDMNSLIYVLFGDPSIWLVNAVKKVSLEVLDSAGALEA